MFLALIRCNSSFFQNDIFGKDAAKNLLLGWPMNTMVSLNSFIHENVISTDLDCISNESLKYETRSIKFLILKIRNAFFLNASIKIIIQKIILQAKQYGRLNMLSRINIPIRMRVQS